MVGQRGRPVAVRRSLHLRRVQYANGTDPGKLRVGIGVVRDDLDFELKGQR